MERKKKFSLKKSYSLGQLNGFKNTSSISSNGNIKYADEEINQNSIGLSADGSFGYEEPSGSPPPGLVFIRVSLPDQQLQRCIQFQLDETVWVAKQTILSTLAKDLKDGYNYGLYCPPMNGRAAKFLDEERLLRDYPLPGPIGFLEFKCKRKVYRLMHVNPRKMKQLHTKANLKQFMECVKNAQIDKILKTCNKGLDPNFHENSTGETPLTLATSLPNPKDVVSALVNGGAHLDFRTKEGLTPMHRAASHGNIKAIRVLLELGSSPNYKDKRNLTPTYYSVCNDTSPLAVELLLHDHAVLDTVDEQGWTEVHQSCRFGRVQHLELLLFYGADMNLTNASGNTPLHVCAAHNQESCARVLLFRGANKDHINFSNQTACQVAGMVGNFELADIIRKHSNEDVVPFKERPLFNEKRRMQNNNTVALIRSRSETRLDVRMVYDPQDSPVSSHYSLPQHYRSVSNLSDSSSVMSLLEYRRASVCGAMSIPGLNSETSSIYAYPRKRLYAALPGRTFVCVKEYNPAEDGELKLQRGDMVEVLSVGEKGFWEGKTAVGEGWFPSDCVEEVTLRNKSNRAKDETDAVIMRRNTMSTLMTDGHGDRTRTVIVQKGKQGFGFVLRGAKGGKSGQRDVTDFQPTSDLPALQYLDRVDKNGNADKAGLKQGDFIMKINNENVVSASHAHVVNLIKESGDVLAMTVLSQSKVAKSEKTHSSTRSIIGLKKNRNRAPLPPKRNPDTQLSVSKARSISMVEGIAELEELDRAIAEHDDNISLYSSYNPRDDNAKDTIASIRSRQSRHSVCEVTDLFLRSQLPVNFDITKSAANLEKPQISLPRTYACPAELKAQYKQKHLLIRASSSPNLLNDNDSGVECSPGGSSTSAAEILTNQFNSSSLDFHSKKNNNGSVYAEAQFDNKQITPAEVVYQEVHMGEHRDVVQLPPSHPPPPPPTRKPKIEVVPINTLNASDIIYMNVGASRLENKPEPFESSFRPGTNAKFNTAPAFKQRVPHNTVEENHYASPSDLSAVLRGNSSSTLQYASADITNPRDENSRKLRNGYASKSELEGAADKYDKPSVSFADDCVYDTAKKFIDEHPQATVMLTDNSNEVSAPKTAKNIVTINEDKANSNYKGESKTGRNVPYFLPEADYDTTDDANTVISDNHDTIPIESVTVESSTTDPLNSADVPYYFCLKKRRNNSSTTERPVKLHDTFIGSNESIVMNNQSLDGRAMQPDSVALHTPDPLSKAKGSTSLEPDYYDKIITNKTKTSNASENDLKLTKHDSRNEEIVSSKETKIKTFKAVPNSSSKSCPAHNVKLLMSMPDSNKSFAEQVKMAALARERRAQEHEKDMQTLAEKQKNLGNSVDSKSKIKKDTSHQNSLNCVNHRPVSVNKKETSSELTKLPSVKPEHGNELAAAVLRQHRKISLDDCSSSSIEHKLNENKVIAKKSTSHTENLLLAVKQRRESLSKNDEGSVLHNIELKLEKKSNTFIFQKIGKVKGNNKQVSIDKIHLEPSKNRDEFAGKVQNVQTSLHDPIEDFDVEIGKESFTARAERLRQEYLAKKNLKLHQENSSDSSETSEGRPPVKSKPKRFVLQKTEDGKKTYIHEKPFAKSVITDKCHESPKINESNLTKPSGSESFATLTSAFEALENDQIANDFVIPPPPYYDEPDMTTNVIPPPSNFCSDESCDSFVPPPPSDFMNDDDLSTFDDMESLHSYISTPSMSSSDSSVNSDLHLNLQKVEKIMNIYSDAPGNINKKPGIFAKTDVTKSSEDINGVYEEICAPPPPDFCGSEDSHLYEELDVTLQSTCIPPPLEFDGNSVNNKNALPAISSVKMSDSQSTISVSGDSKKNSTVPSYTKPFRARPIQLWQNSDVGDWIDSLFLSEYKQLFIMHEIDGQHLAEMQRDDFIDIGVNRVGHRLNMERSIKKNLMRQDKDFVL